MKELSYFRPSYVARQSNGVTLAEQTDAHRVVRTAIAVGEILSIADQIIDPAMSAVTRVENLQAEDRFLTTNEVAQLAALLLSVDRALAESIDDEQLPQGPGGERIAREARQPTKLTSGQPDFDRVFELVDGRVALLHSRMSLADLREALLEMSTFLHDAASRDAEVALVE